MLAPLFQTIPENRYEKHLDNMDNDPTKDGLDWYGKKQQATI